MTRIRHLPTPPFESITQWVNVHAISHRHRGKDNRGRFLTDRWTLFYTDKDGKEGAREAWPEHQALFDDCGLDFEWPHNSRLELQGIIPVQLDGNYKPVNVGEYEPYPDTSDTAWHESALPRTRKRP